MAFFQSLAIHQVVEVRNDVVDRAARLQNGVPQSDADAAATQGARCMDCGIPFCMTGCPVNNIIPDWNDLVYRQRLEERDRDAAFDQQLPRIHRPHLPGAVRGRRAC